MKKIALSALGILTLLFAGIILSSNQERIQLSNPGEEMAANNPDRFAWELFVRLFQPINGNIENGTVWENWMSTTNLYKNPCGPPPPWPKSKQRLLPKPRKFQTFFEELNKSGKVFHPSGLTILTLDFDNPYMEEIRINKPMYDYIVENQLYNREVVYQMASSTGISFPKESIVMKVQWKKITKNEMKDYYWRELKQKDTTTNEFIVDTVGLAGFHIVSHALPNWVWTTFEHIKNPGRCDYIGCEDSYGVKPHFIEPNKIVVQKEYPPGKMTPALKQLFNRFDLPEIFKNYQLRGTQTEYSDVKGNPTILGNSVLENNMVQTSSCISCHAMATLNGGDNSYLTVSMPLPPGFRFGISPTNTKGFHPDAFVGTPEPEMYYPKDKNGNIPADSIFYQLDFMWQLANEAQFCN